MHRYLLFALVILVLLIAGIGGTSVAVAFPTIISSFDVSLVLAGWVLSAALVATMLSATLGGKASDTMGRKQMFMMFLGIYGVGSALCAVAPNIELLILFRFIQGIGGGGFLPSATGIVVEAFPHSRQRVIGLLTGGFTIGALIGPNLGGWMTDALGWRSVFWLNLPLVAIALIAAAKLLPRGERKKTQIDLPGAAYFAVSLSALMVVLSMTGNGADPLWLWGMLLVGGIGSGIAFVLRENSFSSPIIDPHLLKHKPFLAANAFSFVLGTCSMGVLGLMPLYAVSVYDMTTLNSGLILTPRSVGMILASTAASFLLVRLGYRRPMLIGTVLIGVVLILLGMELRSVGILGVHFGSTALLLMILGLSGLSVGMVGPASSNACIDLLPQQAATITGIRIMFSTAGGVLGMVAASLVLDDTAHLASGFRIVFFSLAAVLFLGIPLIFAMPEMIRDRAET